jgi:hypothetical protein
MTRWERFKKSLGPMSDEQREAWKPMAYAMQFLGGLKIILAVTILTLTHSW